MVENELEIIEELTYITNKLGGTMNRLTTYDSKGSTSKKIVIEYDVQEKPA